MTPHTNWQEGARHMNDCTYLFAVDIRELDSLTLSLRIVEAKPQAPIVHADENDAIGFLKLGGRPVQEDDTCRQFHLVFDGKYMVLYTVLNESYGAYPAPSEVFTGKLFRSFSKSRLLDYMLHTTHSHALCPTGLLHFEIVCQNHVIDVICTAAPSISVIASTE